MGLHPLSESCADFVQFSLQRARFGLWGESVGLVPNLHGRRLQYDKNLDRPDIRPGIERILNNIKSLLEEAGKVDERYGLTSNIPQGSEVSTSRGLDIFKGSFERFKSRIRKHQKETSAWKVTRWAIHDAGNSKAYSIGSRSLSMDWKASRSHWDFFGSSTNDSDRRLKVFQILRASDYFGMPLRGMAPPSVTFLMLPASA
jgi:hypothetical protein